MIITKHRGVADRDGSRNARTGGGQWRDHASRWGGGAQPDIPYTELQCNPSDAIAYFC